MSIQTQLNKMRLLLFETGLVISCQQLHFHLVKASHQVKKYKLKLAKETNEQLAFRIALIDAYQAYKKNHHHSNDYSHLESLSPLEQQIKTEQLIQPRQEFIHSLYHSLDLSNQEYIHSSATFEQKVKFYWYAVHKDLITSEHWDLSTFYKFPDEFISWQEKVISQNKHAHDYIPFIAPAFMVNQFLNAHFQTAVKAQKIIGPIVKHNVYPCFDSRYFFSQNPASPTLKIETKVENSNPNIDVNKLVDKKDNAFIILQSISEMKLRSAEHSIKVNLFESQNQYLSANDHCISLASLLSKTALDQQPLIIQKLKQQKISPIQFIQFIAERLVKGHQLAINNGYHIQVNPEHFLIVFSGQKIESIIYRDPQVIASPAALKKYHQYSMSIYRLIIKCFDAHLNNFSLDAANQVYLPSITGNDHRSRVFAFRPMATKI